MQAPTTRVSIEAVKKKMVDSTLSANMYDRMAAMYELAAEALEWEVVGKGDKDPIGVRRLNKAASILRQRAESFID